MVCAVKPQNLVFTCSPNELEVVLWVCNGLLLVNAEVLD